jgi:short-subunit dehydrogenase
LKLCGKKYLITGASSGLGLAIVMRLMKIKGTQIIAVARNMDALAGFSNVIPVSLDISKPNAVDFMIDEAIRQMGGIDCVITCAGFGYYESFQSKDYEHIEAIFRTNVLSPLYTLQRVLEKTTGKFSFVLISSMLGKFGYPGMALYSATKHALSGFHDSFIHEKPKRLHFMTAYPMGMDTNFWSHMPQNIPFPHPLQSADKAAVAILDELRKNKQTVYTSRLSQIALSVNHAIPIFFPAYKYFYKQCFQKWRKLTNEGDLF